jgi:hypothetical protein
MGLHRRQHLDSRERICGGSDALRDAPMLVPAAPLGVSKRQRGRLDAGGVRPELWQARPCREPFAPHPREALPAIQGGPAPAYPSPS